MQRRPFIACLIAILLVSGIGTASAQMPPEKVRLFAYSPASNLIAIDVTMPAAPAGESQSIAEIYDVTSGEYRGFIPAQETGFSRLQFNATGDRLTTVTADNFVDTWDLSTFTRTEPSLPGGVYQDGPIAWHPQENWLAASLAREVYIANVDVPDPISFGDNEMTSTVLALAWSPDGSTLALSTATDRVGNITLWDVFTGDPMTAGPILRIVGDPTVAVDWKPDGTALAARTIGGVAIYDAVTGEAIQSLLTGQDSGYTYEIRWSPDGHQIAAGINDGLWIWDVATGEIVAHYTTPRDVTDIAWLSNGQVLHNGSEIGLAINGTGIEGFVLPVVQPTPSPTFTTTPTPTLTLTPTFTPTFTPTHTPTPDTICTLTAANPVALVSAITAANANGTSSDTICLTADSTYSFFSAANSIALPSITTPITIIGSGAILERGSGAPQFRLFNVTASGSLMLQNLTVRNFNAGGGNGGAVQNAGSLTLDGVTVTGNSARFAGGIYSSGTLTVTNSTFMSNSSQENAGAIYLNSGTLTMSDTTLESNSARYGSGVYLNNGTAALTNVTVRSNTANEQGAGIYQRAGTLTITGGLFENNSARFGNGVYVDAGSATLSGVVMRSSTATEEGAAIYNRTGTLSVSGSTFEDNRARYGAAISNRGLMMVSGSVFTGNIAVESGGAVYHQNANTQNDIAQSCFSGNTARFGGAVFSQTASYNAQNNWWGAASGPTSALVNANVLTSPYLTTCPN